MQVTPIEQLPSYVQEAIAAGNGYTKCPTCGRDGKLGLTYVDAIVHANCFRSTCGARYLTVTDPTVRFDRKKVKEARPYDKETKMIYGTARDMLIVDYGLDWRTWDHHGWKLSIDETELIMPIRDAYNRTRGHITRTLYEKPKRVYTYKETAQPFIDWWFQSMNSAPVVVVEDALSACRLSQLGYNAVALLGTGINQDTAREISATADDREIILALDRDAFDKAVKYSRKHAPIWGQIKVLCLTEDIKNMTDDDDIKRLVDG